MEQDVSDPYDRAKEIVNKYACMKFYDTSRLLYLETDASGIGLGARLLQVRHAMNCGHDEVPDNATLCPIVFASKYPLSTEWYYSNI